MRQFWKAGKRLILAKKKSVKEGLFGQHHPLLFVNEYKFSIEEKVRQEYKTDEKRKHNQQINRTHALATTRDILIGVFLKNQFHKAISAFDQVVEKTREIIRPGRNVPRNKKQKKPYAMAYKRL